MVVGVGMEGFGNRDFARTSLKVVPFGPKRRVLI